MADNNKASTFRKNAEDVGQSEGNNTIPDHLADYNLNRPIQPITGMRQGLPNYGDPHFALFLRKVFIKALGYSEDALSRPIVGIINTYSAFNPCHANVPQLTEAAKRGVQLSGGLALEFPTISIHESFSTPTSMFLRNLMSMDTEEMIKAQPVDACIVIGGKCCSVIPLKRKRPSGNLGLLHARHANGDQDATRQSQLRSWEEYRLASRSCP